MRLFTEAEIFETVCLVIGDDGFRAKETIRLLNSDRKEYGILRNEEYAKDRKDFAKLIKEIHGEKLGMDLKKNFFQDQKMNF